MASERDKKREEASAILARLKESLGSKATDVDEDAIMQEALDEIKQMRKERRQARS